MHYSVFYFYARNVIWSEPGTECASCVGGAVSTSGLSEYLALNEFYQVLWAVKVHFILLIQPLLILVFLLMEYLQ